MTKKNFILYPYLFALYPVLYLFSMNIKQFSVLVALIPSAVMLIITFLLLKLFDWIFKEKEKSAFTVSVFFIWLFSYSAFRSILIYEIFGWQFYRHRYFIVIWFVLLFVLSLIVWKKQFNYKTVGKFLTLLVSFLIVFLLIRAGQHLFKKELLPIVSESRPVEKLSIADKDSLPDIYYIILDAYTGQEGLKKYLKFDNSEFLNFLKSRGFYIAEKSHSNYAWTALSLASSLNMDFLPVDSISMSSSLYVKEKFSLTDAILNNKFYALLNSVGYKYEDISIWLNSSMQFSNPKLYYSQFITNNFNLALLQMTFLDRPLVANVLTASAKRDMVRKKMDELRNLNLTGVPRFIYAHFLIPHHPYVFSRDGSATGILEGTLEMGPEHRLYLNQLLFANKEIEKTIDILLSNKSRRKPIIIIQGDHGAYNLAKSKDDNINLRMSILNAYYVPDTCRKNLYSEISPVNSFRIILNSCFHQKYSLLPDKNYYSTFEEYLKLKDVTKLVHQ